MPHSPLRPELLGHTRSLTHYFPPSLGDSSVHDVRTSEVKKAHVTVPPTRTAHSHLMYRLFPSITSMRSSTEQSSLNRISALWILYSCRIAHSGSNRTGRHLMDSG